MRPFIVIGDQTDHGGVVVGSTQTTDTFGKRLARVGDQVTCPKKGHGTTMIVTGDPTMIVDGAPVARHGDKCACGATLIASQFLSGTSEGGGSGVTSSRVDSTRSAPSEAATSVSTDAVAFDDRLQLIDDDSGTPLAHQEYAIKRASGQIEYGTTDDQGHTHLLSSTASAEAVGIYV